MQAATLRLKDGSIIMGDVEKVFEGKVHFKTAFADTLKIPQDQVVAIDSDQAVAVRIETDEVYQGELSTDSSGAVSVASAGGTVSTNFATVKSAWKPGGRDPIIVASERKWSYTAGIEVGGSDGNTENFGAAINVGAVLEGPDDRLAMYAGYRYKETNGIRSEDEQKGGIKYTNFFSGKWGWFVREEIERDSFEGIDFRSTTAAGITRRWIDEKRRQLETSAGFSYRFESYADPLLDDEGFPGLDLSLDHMWQFADWGRMVNSLSYVPSVDDFGDYLLEHETGLDFPLGTSDAWILRIGLSNQYNSNPSGNREELDTTYFTRLILNWD